MTKKKFRPKNLAILLAKNVILHMCVYKFIQHPLYTFH
jgi:hypothetical protein